tara:strand:- start:877 stop:1002 length:126 start_codon:yes stop_codon:yes gene_type:complete
MDLAGCGIRWLLKAQSITPLIGLKIDQTTALYLFNLSFAVA